MLPAQMLSLPQALENAHRHASATRVTVRAAVDGHLLSLTIHDDGTGLPPGTSLEKLRDSGHFGLLGMVEGRGGGNAGLFGTAPSPELLARWNTRERALIGTDPDRVPPLALPPLEENVLGGTATGDTLAAIGRDGARTVPARENGGNHDIKNFTRGSRVFYPVHVPGALFSGGDLHFSQGDGEITFCGAIEMGGFIDFHIDLIKGGMETYGVTTNPILMPGNVEPRYSEFLTFIGIGVDHDTDTQLYNDATVAYRNACLNAVAYLEKFGYSGAQAYLLLGAAPIEGRVSGVVDIPNACCSLYLPTAIFDFDIRPSASGPVRADRGSCAVST